MKVFVLDKNHKPLMPCQPARARKLLKVGRAVVVKRVPFTIRLKDRIIEESVTQPVRLKLDPGSKVTGIAIVRETEYDATVLHLAELHHRGSIIKSQMDQRRARRRRRRTKNLRHRPPRFNNRTRPNDWLPPSLQSRVDNILSWTHRYQRLVPITVISVETARFDTQKLQNPEINGVEYQRGTLFGYEVWEYLLEKWGRKCAYCGREDVPLEKEHIIPRSRGGSNRISNLTVSCYECNQLKGNRTAAEFGHPEIEVEAKKPLKDAAAVNSTRWAIWHVLSVNGVPVEVGTGGRTKFNRNRLGLPKTHSFDALCVGASTPFIVKDTEQEVLIIRAVGRGRYQRTTLDKYGFPRGYSKRQKHAHGLKTGDLVKATILTGKYAGTYLGNVVIRHEGHFKVKQHGKVVAEGHPKYFRLLERAAGYELNWRRYQEEIGDGRRETVRSGGSG